MIRMPIRPFAAIGPDCTHDSDLRGFKPEMIQRIHAFCGNHTVPAFAGPMNVLKSPNTYAR
ncbi:protein of unknown function [Methylococcus capsulatus]|uniref:Uncharacterized protein n=1 Tax=Methylococcus capsulatus TaxID=414 RepID=A0AA35Y191_METCP|nr:protein of unknown function [Methylococcus capsulatus]